MSTLLDLFTVLAAGWRLTLEGLDLKVLGYGCRGCTWKFKYNPRWLYRTQCRAYTGMQYVVLHKKSMRYTGLSQASLGLLSRFGACKQ